MCYSLGIHWPELTWLIYTCVFICQVSCFDALLLTRPHIWLTTLEKLLLHLMTVSLNDWGILTLNILWLKVSWSMSEHNSLACHDEGRFYDFDFQKHVACILFIIIYFNEARMITGYIASQMNTQSNQTKLFTVHHEGLYLKNTRRWLKHAKNH